MVAKTSEITVNDFVVFGAKPKDALLVPEMPIAVRNNCQSGENKIPPLEENIDPSYPSWMDGFKGCI